MAAEACSLAAAAGFTIVQNYNFQSARRVVDPDGFVSEARAYLDVASRYKLKALMGFPKNWLLERREAPIRAVIRGLRDHPQIVCWYEEEIGQEGNLDAVQFLARLVNEEDPARGLIIEEASRDERLLDIGKVRMFTYYPTTNKNRRRRRLMSLTERFPVQQLRVPFWPVLQAFGSDLIVGGPPTDLVTPSFQELDYSLHSALIAGARGIFFYPYSHPTDYDPSKAKAGIWAYGDYKPLPQAAPELWRSVLACAAKARRLLPLSSRGRSTDTFHVVRPPRYLETAQWKTPQGDLLMLANPTYEAKRIRIRTRDAGSIQFLSGPERTPRRVSAGRLFNVVVPGPGGIAVLLGPDSRKPGRLPRGGLGQLSPDDLGSRMSSPRQ